MREGAVVGGCMRPAACAHVRRGRASSRRATGAGALSRRGGAIDCFRVAAVIRAGAALAVPALSSGCAGRLDAALALLCGRSRLLAHPRDGLADQLLDRRDALLVGRRDHGDGGAAAPGAPGTADAVDVVVGMVRHVEIEDVADGGNVEPARGDIGGDQQRRLRSCGTESSAAVRADWSMSPCSATAEKPWRTSERCSAATSRLRLQKTIAFFKPSAERMRRRSVSRLSCGSRPVLTSSWVVVATVVAGRELRPSPDCAGTAR